MTETKFYQPTPEELVDIVDVELNIISQSTKLKAHTEGLLHKTVIAGIRNSDNKILLVQQASDRQDAGQFVSPVGGHVRSGESDEDALRREAEEEVGYKNIDFKLIGSVIYERHVIGRHENHYFIYYEIQSDERPVLGDESVSYRVFTLEELGTEYKTRPKIFGAAYRVIYEKFYK